MWTEGERIIRRWAAEHDRPVITIAWRRRSDSERNDYVAAYRAGTSVTAIARTHGVNVNTVYRALRDAGIRPDGARRHA